MNDSARVLRRHRHRRAWPPAARAAAAIAATAALALLAAACSSGSPSSGGSTDAGGSANSRLVAYSQCMRSHGMPNFPDPTGGVPPKVTAQELGVSSSQLQAAQRACQSLLPATGGSLTASSLQQCYLAGICPQALDRKSTRLNSSHSSPSRMPSSA